MVKTKKVLVRIPLWMHNALAAEKRSSDMPTSINKLILDALFSKYKKIAVTLGRKA
jgi:hypothetical protein